MWGNPVQARGAGNPGAMPITAVDATEGYYVQGTKVLGAPQPPVADADVGEVVDLAGAIRAIGVLQTQLNATLARLRAHGLVQL